MPQSGLTEEQAYRLAQEQSKARREGRPIPPPPVRLSTQPKYVMSEEDAYRLAQEQTKARKEGRPIPPPPVRTRNMKQGMTIGMGNTDKSVFGPPKAPESGGDTLDFIRKNQDTPLGKALAYGVSLVQESVKKGQPKDRSEYMRLLAGSEQFRSLDPESQQKARLGMQQWFQTQSMFNPVKALEMKKRQGNQKPKVKMDEAAEAKKVADMISIF